MSRPPVSVADLRQLLAARFSPPPGRASASVPTGVAPLDETLGGGLPQGQLTELVVGGAGCGGQTVLAQLLHTTRAARQRVALVDAADAFAPETVPPAELQHLVWVRCTNSGQALAAADLLVRDANYAVVVLDLRGCAEGVLRRLPGTVWHRLHRAAQHGGAVLVQTAQPLVPAVPWRVVLPTPWPLERRRRPRAELAEELAVAVARGRWGEVVAFEEKTG